MQTKTLQQTVTFKASPREVGGLWHAPEQSVGLGKRVHRMPGMPGCWHAPDLPKSERDFSSRRVSGRALDGSEWPTLTRSGHRPRDFAVRTKTRPSCDSLNLLASAREASSVNTSRTPAT